MKRGWVVAAGAVALSVVVPGVAFAGSNGASFDSSTATGAGCRANFSGAQQKVEQAISARVTRIQLLQNRVANAKYLTSSDASALGADLSNQMSGMQALETKVKGDTTCAELRTEAVTGIRDYRVYEVMTPQVDLVVASDAEAGVEQFVSSLEPRIQQALGACTGCAGAEQVFGELQSKLTAAEQLTNSGVNGQSVSSAVLAVTPQGYPGNRSILIEAHTAVVQVRGDLGAIRGYLHSLVSDLVPRRGRGGSTTTA